MYKRDERRKTRGKRTPADTDEHESHSSVTLLRQRAATRITREKRITDEDSWGIIHLHDNIKEHLNTHTHAQIHTHTQRRVK